MFASPRAHDTPPLKIGLIGCGEVTRAKHLPALRRIPTAQVTALCDLDPARARAVAAQFHVPRAVSDPAHLLAFDDLDVVGVLTPPESHVDLAIAALAARRPVYVEKPLALDVPSCQHLLHYAHAARLPAVTGFHMRFHRLVRHARDILRSGALGPIESVRLVWHSPRSDDGIPAWKTRRHSGGGALIEIGVHHLDLVRFLLDDEFAAILALSRDHRRHDECAILAARTCSGVLVTAEFSERSPHEIEFTVSSATGLLRVDCLRFDGLQLRRPHDVAGAPALRLRALLTTAAALPSGLRTHHLGGDYRISYENIWRHFLLAIQTHTQPEVTLHDGLRATLALDAALQSRLTRQLTKVP
jgi:predicted dehydrogenase